MPSCDEVRVTIDDDLHLKWMAVTGRSPDELGRLHKEYNVVHTWKFDPRAFTERMISAARDAKDNDDLTKRVELDVASQARDQETLRIRMLNDSHTQLWRSSSSDPRNYVRQVCKRSSSRQNILEGLAALLYQEEKDAMESCCSAGGSGDSAGNNADDGSGSGSGNDDEDEDDEPSTLYMPPQMEIIRTFFESEEAGADGPGEKLTGGSEPACPTFAHKPPTRSPTTSTISEQDNTSWPVIDRASPSICSVLLDVESTKSESYVSDAADQNTSSGSQTTDCVLETPSNDCHTKSELPSPDPALGHQHSDGDQGSTLQAQRPDRGERERERDYESPQSRPCTKGRFDHGISPPDGQRKHPLHEDQDQGGGTGLKRRRIS
ncbi:hypothetical protein C2857_006130 [Epichloe festucae Fl1]|uniref:Uncharacterized protein n=2 Tax=Epichloe festucae TaxID=35717 RepID=A0A7S9KLF2_EPIFF|nr:hypothetical protein 17A8-14 [Epichloe festucae]QPG94467.1 hypothetical protein C2857_006130 [Epichloe festucae Fl1]